MKVSDIKGDFGQRVIHWVNGYIDNLISDEIIRSFPGSSQGNHISIWSVEDFKKLCRGKIIGFKTHGYTDEDEIHRNWIINEIQLRYCKDLRTPSMMEIDVYDPYNLFRIELDFVDKYEDGRWWVVKWSVKADPVALLDKLSSMFDKDLLEMKTALHKDILGRTLKIGDVVCYSTTINNGIHVGTIKKFNDCKMVVDNSDVPYDAGVLCVNESVRHNSKTKRYEHTAG